MAVPVLASTSQHTHQLPGQPGSRSDRLLPSAQKAFAQVATAHSVGGEDYPELTLFTLLIS
jgi:hypothetical protein